MKKLLIIISFTLIATSLSANITVRLDRLYCISSGEIVDLPILLENSFPSYQLGGFDFLIEHDSRLIFLQASPGELLTNCGWEYFTYSSPSVNTIRVVALAETNNGPNHPSCFAETSGKLASLRFQIASDTTFINDFLPVWWSWSDCGDNTVSSQDGNALYISDSVYFFNGSNETNITQDAFFPTPYGSQAECIAEVSPTPIRMIDFYTGGFDISPNGFQVTCISDIVTANDSGTCGAIVAFEIPINSSCAGMGVENFPPSGSFFPIGSTIVTSVATDNIGHIDSCSFFITIEDREAPTVIEFQTDTTLYTVTGEWWSQLSYDFSAIDNCSEVTLSSSHPTGSYFAIGNTTVYCFATDSSGNVDTTSFVVTVIDNEAPVVTCPETIFLPNENSLCGAVVQFLVTASDNSLQSTLTVSETSGTFFQVGTTYVAATAVDPYGNFDSSGFYIIIEDVEPPQISCIENIVIANDIGTCGAVVTYDIIATDNCGTPTIENSVPSGSFFPIGSTLVVSKAVDNSLNIDSCLFYVIVQDNEPPQISAPLDIVTSADPDACGAIVAYEFTVSDNCSGYTVQANYEAGSFFEIGSTLVLLEVTDVAGLKDSASFTIVVEDNQPPTISNYPDLNLFSDSGFYGAVVNYDPLISDNCQLDSVTINPQSGAYFEIGFSEVQIVAVDMFGNIDSVTFIVNVELQDVDNDQVADFEDNCVTSYNPLQKDSDANGVGDACCCVGIRGNIDNGFENPPSNNGIDISDIVFLVAYMFGVPSGPSPACPAEADIDASGAIDISDIVHLVGYMFGDSGVPPQNCL